MSSSATRNVAHEITVEAPGTRVYQLIADVSGWPSVFGPTVHVEYVEQAGATERIRIWATANGTAKSWVSRRDHDPGALRIAFRQERSQHPVGGMGGVWIVQPLSGSACRVRLLHDYFAASDDPADLEWIDKAVDRNSTAELAALKSAAESTGPDELLTFADTVEVDGSAADVYDFLNEAQLWKERLPHVSRVLLDEETPGLQVLEMDTRTKDGSVHTTRSVRVCQPHRRIVYKQVVLPALMSLHTGYWLIEERAGQPVSVTSQHTVRIAESRIADVLGTEADPPAARAFVRTALSGNSMATLRQAKAYAERARADRAARADA
jgi:aromatase